MLTPRLKTKQARRSVVSQPKTLSKRAEHHNINLHKVRLLRYEIENKHVSYVVDISKTQES